MGCCCLRSTQNKVTGKTTNLTLQIHQTHINLSYPTKSSARLDNGDGSEGVPRHHTESGLFTHREEPQSNKAPGENLKPDASQKNSQKKILTYSSTVPKPALVPVSKAERADNLYKEKPSSSIYKVDIGVNYTKNVRVLHPSGSEPRRANSSSVVLPPIPLIPLVPPSPILQPRKLLGKQVGMSESAPPDRQASPGKKGAFWSEQRQEGGQGPNTSKPERPNMGLQERLSECRSELEASGYSPTISIFRDFCKPTKSPILMEPVQPVNTTEYLENSVPVKNFQIDDNFERHSLSFSDEEESRSFSIGLHHRIKAAEAEIMRREAQNNQLRANNGETSFQIIETIKTRSIWDDMKRRNKSANDAILKKMSTSKSPKPPKDPSIKPAKPANIALNQSPPAKKRGLVKDAPSAERDRKEKHKEAAHASPEGKIAADEPGDTPRRLSMRYSSKKWDNNKSAIDTISEHFSSEDDGDNSISLRGGHRNDRFDEQIQGKNLRISAIGLEHLKKRNMTDVNF